MKRLFIGLPIQSETAFRLADGWRNDPLVNMNRMAWTNPATWHVTLYFLGATPESDLVLLQQLLDTTFNEVEPFSSRLSGLGVFPENGKPRILWLGLETLQPLLSAYVVLGDMLQKNGFHFDPKPLKPHLTLARIKSLTHPSSIQSLQTDFQFYHFGTVEIKRVTLFESLSTKAGVIYQPLSEKWFTNSRELGAESLGQVHGE